MRLLILFTLTTALIANVAAAENSSPFRNPKSSVPKPATKPDYTEPPLKAGNQITILRWDAASKTMIVALTEESAVGPNISTLKDLLDAIDFEDVGERRKFIASPNLLKGLTFTLKRNLKLIPYIPGAKNVPARI